MQNTHGETRRAPSLGGHGVKRGLQGRVGHQDEMLFGRLGRTLHHRGGVKRTAGVAIYADRKAAIPRGPRIEVLRLMI